MTSSSSTHAHRRLDADALTAHDIEALMKQCSPRAATGVRNRALIALAYRTGLRIGEVLALQLKDVDLTSGTLVVQHGKNDKRRVVGLDSGAWALVERWLIVRQKKGISKKAPIFCTLAGAPIDQAYIRHLLPRLARKADVGKRVHAHAFRHAFAVEIEREGAPISTIRDLLGHSSAAVTDRYLRRVGASEAIDFARCRSWVGEP
jgi:site-specific recombinase XerD